MLGILIVIIATYFTTKARNLEIDMYSVTNKKTILILVIIMDLVFLILHALLSKNKKMGRYDENWFEDEIRVLRGMVVVAEGFLYIRFLRNIDGGLPIYHNIWVFCGIIIILNFIQFKLIDHFYSKDVRELLVDTLLMQVQDARNTLILILACLCILHFTIVGFLFILSLIAIVLRW